jgi:hypothetical protein
LADKLGDANALAHAALGYVGPHRIETGATVTQPIADLLQRSLIALHEDDSPLRAQLMGRLATAFINTGVESSASALARQALEMARRVAGNEILADSIASVLWTTRHPDATHESMVLAQELARLADKVGDRRLRAVAHWWLVDVLLELGDITAVESELDAL